MVGVWSANSKLAGNRHRGDHIGSCVLIDAFWPHLLEQDFWTVSGKADSPIGCCPGLLTRWRFHGNYPRRGEESVSVGPIIRQVTGGIRYPYVRYNDHRRPPGAASGQRSHRMVTQCTETLLAKGDDSSR